MQVHAIQTGTVTVKEAQREGQGGDRTRIVHTLRDKRWTAPLPIYAWVIRHPEGVIVVDTGETAAASEPGYFPRWHPYFRLAVRMSVTSDQEIGPQLDRLGIDRAEVRWVVLTHLHTDHAGGLAHFPDAEILVARREYEAASGFTGKLNGYLPDRLPGWLAPRLLDLPEDPFGPFPRSLALTEAGDVRILATPGHSPGHMSVVLSEDDERLV
ncbi:MAG TPA: N-acyl homoserine lactonase family protein, partial [Thermoleophilaceae bacterium]|nr:N-acyl homoserine lactonase family protein [Thermoleophilaceae bacterium]